LPLPAHTVRFGPFELDLSTAELRNNGATSKLAEQPFQILAELVQHPGEVVTRDELRQRLWHSDTFVDFEYGLNAAVKRLREVLGDSADSPRYIETIPRRGYRFIAAVTEAPLPAGLEAKKNNLWKVAVPAAVLLLAALIAGWLFYPWRQVRVLTDKDTIVLADIDNKTGDPVFDDSLKQGLSVQLEQSPFLALLSERKVIDTLKLMGRSPDDRLTANVAREVCLRAGSTTMVTGSIAGLGNQYVIGLKAVNCNTGDTLAELQEQAAGKEAVLKALDAAAVSMRSKLGESLSSVEKYATPLEEATTPSLEALKVYGLGRKTQFAKGETAALPFYKRAVELDPNFGELFT
jgi:DNA-binding winged helix-turn-helix (wHTH) protein